jgi:hypothetical protein
MVTEEMPPTKEEVLEWIRTGWIELTHAKNRAPCSICGSKEKDHGRI